MPWSVTASESICSASVTAKFSSVAATEQMGRLYRHVRKTIGAMAAELHAGAIEADPYFRSQKDRACENCDFLGACHFAEGAAGESSRCLRKLTPEEVWARMEKEDESHEQT